MSSKVILSVFMLSVLFAQENFAVAIHGGAGVIRKSIDPKLKDAYLSSLSRALSHALSMLKSKEKALDVVVEVIEIMENDSLFNAGKGAVYTNTGEHELDASIMDGSNLEIGAITGIKRIKNPIKLARKVMDHSRHVLFAGSGAESFAKQFPDIEWVDNHYFDTNRRYKSLLRSQEKNKIDKKGTVGVVVLDSYGNLAAGTSTGGLTNKRFGRIGDSPIIGAGTYANNRTCAVSSTGTGEEFIRHNVAFHISSLMQYAKMSLEEAAKEVVFKRLKKGDGGIISVDKDGNIALVFNTKGMFRGKANSKGLFEVKIWE